MKETKKARAARLQQARDAAAEALNPERKLGSRWVGKGSTFQFRRKVLVRSCDLHKEEACVLCTG
jgi:hypothetical protein